MINKFKLEFAKLFRVYFVILSAFFVIIVLFQAVTRYEMYRTFSRLNLIAGQNVSLLETLSDSIFLFGNLVVGFTLIVSLSQEFRQGVYKKMLISGYKRIDLYLNTINRACLIALMFTILTVIVYIVLGASYGFIEGNFWLYLGSKIWNIFVSFFYTSFLAMTFIVVLQKTYLSLGMFLLLYFLNSILSMANIMFDSLIIDLLPLSIVDKIADNYNFINIGNISLLLTYLFAYNLVTFLVFKKKDFY